MNTLFEIKTRFPGLIRAPREALHLFQLPPHVEPSGPDLYGAGGLRRARPGEEAGRGHPPHLQGERGGDPRCQPRRWVLWETIFKSPLEDDSTRPKGYPE